MGLRCGPSYQLFIRFQSEFGGLNQDTTDLVLLDWSTLSQDMEIQARKVLEWAEKCLNEKTFPRDDYHELVELTVVYLGRSVARGFKIRKPGAHHSARFLAYCIYIFKMEMMSDRFLLSQNERHQVHRLAVFIALIHSQAFLRSRIAIIAPALDTQYLFLLHQFKKEEKRVAEVAIHSFYNHLWYVTPELVLIAIFDNSLPSTFRKQMVDRLLLFRDGRQTFAPGKQKFPTDFLQNQESISESCLLGCISKRSWLLFSN